jgi:hypothetical protein
MEEIMTKRIGNKNEAQHRGKKERKAIHKANVESEAIRRADARARYRNAVKGQAPLGLPVPVAAPV